MQSTQFQIDKLHLIEQIIQLEDEATLDYIKSVLNQNLEYVLSEEQKNEVRESASNYLFGKDKGKSWEDVKKKLK